MRVEQEMPQRWAPRHVARVLLAEDDPEMRSLMALALRSEGYDVQEAEDGNQVLEALGTIDAEGPLGEADLIVSDVQMPGCSGFEMLERMRADDLHVPVILVTAFGDWSTHARAERLGASVLDKPFDLDDLRKMAFEALELG